MKISVALLFVLAIAGWANAQRPIEFQMPKSDWDSYYKNAVAGDYATYVDLQGKILRHIDILSIGDRQATINVSKGPGTDPYTQVLKFVGPARTDQGPTKVSRVVLIINEQKIDCQLTEYLGADGKVMRRQWNSNKTPLDGMVKVEVVKHDGEGKEIVTAGQALIGFRYANAPK